MLKYLLSFFILFFTSQFSAQPKKFFKTGSAELSKPVEKLPLNFQNDLPFVKVNIKGKVYNFLFDTGAPTIISSAIYKELALKSSFESEVGDSQKSVQKQIFTVLPEINMGNIRFKNIGAIVVDFTQPEFKCFRLDGIIGSNQMALLFWKVNYLENSMLVSKDFEHLYDKDFSIKIPFKANRQKIPFINSKIFDKNISIEIDTGYSGLLQFNKSGFDIEQNVAKNQLLLKKGINSIGMYGAGRESVEAVFKINKLTLANDEFKNQIIETGSMHLLGNRFLKNYEFILDWKKNYLYLKPVSQPEKELKSFGFGYRFIKNKAVVAFVYQDKNLPIQINDEILNINGISLENLTDDQSCEYYINRIEKNLEKTTITVKRGKEIKSFELEKITYF